jgi:hypothetical protein
MSIAAMDVPAITPIRRRYQFFDFELPVHPDQDTGAPQPTFHSVGDIPSDKDNAWHLIAVAGKFERQAAFYLNDDAVPFYLPLRRFQHERADRSGVLLTNYLFACAGIDPIFHALRDCRGLWAINRIYDFTVRQQLLAVEDFLKHRPDGQTQRDQPGPGKIMVIAQTHAFRGLKVRIESLDRKGNAIGVLILPVVGQSRDIKISTEFLEAI